LFTDPNLVVGQYAKFAIDQGVPIASGMLSSSPGVAAGPGSPWVTLIPSGMTAISIPITRLSSMAYGIRDGDRVDVIASMLLADLDASYQSLLPNNTAGVIPAGSHAVISGGGTAEEPEVNLNPDEMITNLVAQSISGMAGAPFGRAEFDANFQTAFYVVPSESQRPRLVSQMVMQNVPVLRVGTFPLPGQAGEEALAQAGQAAAAGETITAAEAEQAAAIEKPDVITLIVYPQDAIALDYLMKSGAFLTLTLRGPGVDDSRIVTESVTLQYLLSQYNISVPAKLPYGLVPRLDVLLEPTLPNDIIVVTSE